MELSNAATGGIMFRAETDERGTIEQLDASLEALEGAIGELTVRVGPISNQYATSDAKLAEPRPEPKTQLLGRVERLGFLVNRLREVTGEIDL